MKSILISIQPKWVEKIASGEKTIEVRKTRPKIETPFKCYIYCSRSKNDLFWLDEEIKDNDGLPKGLRAYNSRLGNGSVVGEFICDRVLEWKYLQGLNDENEKEYWILSKDGHDTCLSYDEIENYGKGKTLYGWHISDLKIYGKPKELSEFKSCSKCKYRKIAKICFDCDGFTIKRPPQSWQFVND